MRRVALFSDIHGNLPALDAVLADIDSSGCEERYCLGDLVGYGPDPAGVIARIRETGIPTVRGNYDEGIGQRRGECGCYYATEQARSDGAASYAFTDALVSVQDASWLATLPLQTRFEHGGGRVLLTHGSPRKINEYLLPDRTDAQLRRLAEGAGADVVCVGHVHIPYVREIPRVGAVPLRYVSTGSVGKPKDGDPRACWAEVVFGDAGGLEAMFHRTAYDIDSVAAAMEAAGLPPTLVSALRSS